MTIEKNLFNIKKTIKSAADRCGRDPDTIKLIAVSKTKPINDILEAVKAGQLIFGENYAQELRDKAEEIATLSPKVESYNHIEWHFIGHMQKNKIKHVLPVASWIHTIDSVELLEAINNRFNDKTLINCLIEVNIANEASKSGISPENLFPLVEAFSKTDKLVLKGLMCMPPISDNPENSRPYFKKLQGLLNEVNRRNIYPEKLTELSMGMTQDYNIAIEEGSTMLRIGTAIFGGR